MIRVFEDIFHIALGEVLVSHDQIVQGESVAVGQQNAHTGLRSYPAIGVTVFVERNDAVFFDERAVDIFTDIVNNASSYSFFTKIVTFV